MYLKIKRICLNAQINLIYSQAYKINAFVINVLKHKCICFKSGRHDVGENFETDGLLQIEQ